MDQYKQPLTFDQAEGQFPQHYNETTNFPLGDDQTTLDNRFLKSEFANIRCPDCGHKQVFLVNRISNLVTCAKCGNSTDFGDANSLSTKITSQHESTCSSTDAYSNSQQLQQSKETRKDKDMHQQHYQKSEEDLLDFQSPFEFADPVSSPTQLSSLDSSVPFSLPQQQFQVDTTQSDEQFAMITPLQILSAYVDHLRLGNLFSLQCQSIFEMLSQQANLSMLNVQNEPNSSQQFKLLTYLQASLLLTQQRLGTLAPEIALFAENQEVSALLSQVSNVYPEMCVLVTPQQLIVQLCERLGVQQESTFQYVKRSHEIQQKLVNLAGWRECIDKENMMVHARLLAAVAMFSLRPQDNLHNECKVLANEFGVGEQAILQHFQFVKETLKVK